jgi:hypothetical protein
MFPVSAGRSSYCPVRQWGFYFLRSSMARPLLLSVQQPVLNEFDSSLSVNIERGKEDGME